MSFCLILEFCIYFYSVIYINVCSRNINESSSNAIVSNLLRIGKESLFCTSINVYKNIYFIYWILSMIVNKMNIRKLGDVHYSLNYKVFNKKNYNHIIKNICAYFIISSKVETYKGNNTFYCSG